MTVLFVGFATSTVVLPQLGAADSDPAEKPVASEHPKLDEIARQLDLTDAQKAKIAPIMKQEFADLQALKADTSSRRMQKMRKARAITARASTQIRAELNPDQQTKYDALRAEWKKQMKERLAEKKSGG